MSSRRVELGLGPALVGRMLALGPPILLVDRLDAFEPEPKPTVHARRLVSGNDPLYRAHFAAMPVVPGTHLLEGLSQCGALLSVLLLLRSHAVALGRAPEDPLAELRNVELGLRADPAYKPGEGDALLALLTKPPERTVGMLAASSMKWLKPVFPGSVVHYRARLQRRLEELWSTEVEAEVDGVLVAQGTLTNVFRRLELPAL